MRISASGTSGDRTIKQRSSRRINGFSLIEILVVLFIIGMAIGMASLSMRAGGASELQDEAEHFLLSARFVSEQAILNREIIGLFVEPERMEDSIDTRWCYEWRRYLDQSWQPASDYLEQHCLPVDVQLEMVVEGEPYEYDPRETSPKPVLAFYPGGEATPFEMALLPEGFADDDEQVQRIEIDLMGRIRWRNEEEARAAAEQGL